MRQSPLQQVKKNFESRAALVAKLAPLVDKQHGDSSDDQAKARLMGLSNKKLLRLWQVEQQVRERFGDRNKLVASIIDARKKAGATVDDNYKTKLEGFTKARLLDLSNMTYGERPAKLTPEQKLKSKRGRKQRERALTAIAKRK